MLAAVLQLYELLCTVMFASKRISQTFRTSRSRETNSREQHLEESKELSSFHEPCTATERCPLILLSRQSYLENVRAY